MPETTFGKALIQQRQWSRLTDLLIYLLALSGFYVIVKIGATWLGPFTPAVQISHNPYALPKYAAFSLLRIGIAYFFSLSFAIIYGYTAAYYPRAERILIPLLDILQSIPVLSFLPGIMLAMVALFPHSQIGVEMGSILLIFTGQVWNIAFSFYSSLKNIPRELNEASYIYRFSRWQRFNQLEMPFAAIGVVWNSMMSVAGGWFFLMACEMFVLGNRDFRLPGLGSYLQTAASAGDTPAILWGMAVMIGIIVFLDQIIWRPIIIWSSKFKFEQVESADQQTSFIIDILYRARAIAYLRNRIFKPLSEYIMLSLAHRHTASSTNKSDKIWKNVIAYLLLLVLLIFAVTALVKSLLLIFQLSSDDLKAIFYGAGATFLRVNAALIIGAAWTIPVGVAIGFNPRMARIAQPLAQIAASVPATALFPVLLLFLIRAGGGLAIASILLMLLGTQWYILFNVIAGAMAIPTDLKEAANIYRFNRIARWRVLILPGIFPYLITGLVTASGGAWNASIVAEYFHFKGALLATTGLGATISQATDSGRFDLLLAATILMAAMVVTVNRLVWRRLYRLAEKKFKLEV